MCISVFGDSSRIKVGKNQKTQYKTFRLAVGGCERRGIGEVFSDFINSLNFQDPSIRFGQKVVHEILSNLKAPSISKRVHRLNTVCSRDTHKTSMKHLKLIENFLVEVVRFLKHFYFDAKLLKL